MINQEQTKKRIYHQWWFWAIIILLLSVIKSVGAFFIFIAVSCLIVGLIRPSIFNKLSNIIFKTYATRNKVFLIFVLALIVITIVDTIANPPKDGTQANNKANQPKGAIVQQQSSVEKNEEKAASSTKPESRDSALVKSTPAKTDQQILEENLFSIVSKSGLDMSYKKIEIEKSDSDRPKDTKMITVSVDVKSFLNKNSLLHGTGKLSSEIFQAIYSASSLNAYDVIVWYYGQTTDRYGNQNSDVVLAYSIDKKTFEKIYWQNFDKSNLCDFLKSEASLSGTFDTACNVLVDIK